MGKGIRGITVEIGGDTTKLGKAIGDTEKKSRSLQNELRQVEKLLKFDPTNVELLSQKQEILTDSISETSKKLDLLKEAEKQVTEQFKRGEVSEEQVRALQREIIKTENSLESMKSELNATETSLKKLADGTDNAKKHTKEYAESVDKAKKELEDFKEKASDTFDKVKTGASVVGGALVATGGYALKLSTDFDKASNTLITKTGATTNEIDELNTAMETVYANNFGESIEDVAESMAIVRQNTKYVGDELVQATEDAILFRDTFGFEVEESTRSAKMLMEQFGLTSHEAYNLMAQGAQNGLNKNGDLMDVVNEYSVHFQQLGFDAEEMFNILTAGAESGAFSVDKVGDAFKEFGIRVKDESDATKDAFTQLGLDADKLSKAFAKGGDDAVRAYLDVNNALTELDDPLKQNQIGVALYGTMWEDLGATVVEAMYDYGDAYNSTIDTMESINDIKYDDIGSALQGLGRTIETDLINPLGEELKPVVEDVIDYVEENGPQIKDTLSNIVKKVGEFVGYIVANGPAILSVISGIGAGFVAWNVASTIKGVVNGIKAFKLANEGATVAQALLNGVMNANPIMLVATLVATLVTALITFIVTNDEARAKFLEVWEKIKSAFSAVADWFSTTIPKIGEFFSNLWSDIVSVFQNAGSWFDTNVIQPIVEFFKGLWDKVSGFFTDLWNGIVSVWQTVSDWFDTYVVQPIVNLFQSIATWVNENIITPITTFYETYMAPVINKIIEMAKKLVEIVGALFVGLWNLLNENVIQPIANGFRELWAKVKEFFTNLWNDIVAIWNTVSEWFNTNVIQPVVTIFNELKTKVTEFFTNLWADIVSVWNTVSTWFTTNVTQPVTETFQNLKASISESATNAWNSVTTAFGNVKTWFKEKFTEAWTAVKEVFSSWGSFFGGLWTTIKDKFTKIGTNIANAISNAVKSGINGVISAIERTINRGVGLINGAINMINKLPGVSVGKISSISLPRLAKGGIVDRPTVAEIGENGREAIVPLEKNLEWVNGIAKKISEQIPTDEGINVSLLEKLDGIYERLGRLQMVTETGALIGEILDGIDAGLAEKQSLKLRGA